MAEVKPEIKVDPAGESPSKLGDIDEFEDDTDLQFPPADTRGAWLVKVSENMWKAWNQLYKEGPADQEVEVGRLRVYTVKPGEDASRPRIQMRLNDVVPQNHSLPKLYNLDFRAISYNNTVVFCEKDLPGHRAQQFGTNRNLAVNRPSGIVKSERYGPRKTGSYRTAIPKQTALAPPILNELIAKPVEDENSLDFFKKQYDAAMNAGKKVTYSNKIDKGRNHPGTASTFTFGSITSKPGKSKKKQPKEKAVRISRTELLDKLQQCFQRYKYWSLKALRGELHQPEAWIKEGLEDMAVLMKSGDFTGNYRLNDSTAKLLQMQNTQFKQEVAPIKQENESDGGTGDEMGDGDDDDEMDDFEDVNMEGNSS